MYGMLYVYFIEYYYQHLTLARYISTLLAVAAEVVLKVVTKLVTLLRLTTHFDVLCIRVETGSGHPGQLCHLLSGSSRSDPVYKISGSDPDSALHHVH